MKDSSIVELFFKRDGAAIAETKGKYGRYCKVIAKNILGSEEDSEECVSDALFKLWNNIPPARPEKLGTFLSRITRNLAIDKYRIRTAEKRRGSETALCLEELEECIGESGSIEDEVALRDSIDKFLSRQRQAAKEIFMLRYFYMFSVSEISARTGVKEGAVKMSLSRTRAKLHDFLTKEGFDI